MRKIIIVTILLCFLFINSCYAFSDIQSSKAEDAIQTLYSLGVIKGCDNDSFCPQNAVTRAEFTAMLVRALDFDSGTLAGNAADFSDVPANHWAAGDIYFGVSSGLISGYGDQTFRPDNEITYSEIIKLLVSAVGYSPMAEKNGGYPNGYMAMAAQIGITKRVEFAWDEAATRENVAQLLYQTMLVEVVDPIYGHDDSYQLTDETLMSRFMEGKKLLRATGIVTSIPKTGLKGESRLGDYYVCIDGVVYEQGNIDFEPFLGMRVKVYYYQANKGDIPVITSVFPFNNDTITIQADDLLKVDLKTNTIEYGDSMREQLAPDFSLIYNGKAVGNVTFADMHLINGTMTLLDNSADSIYDVVFIEESFNVVVEKVSDVGQIIFLKSGTIGGVPRIDLSSEHSDFDFSIHDTDGSVLDISDLSEGDILNVKADKSLSLIDITVHTEKISGIVREYSFDDNEVVINDKTYRIGKDEKGIPMITTELNESGIYYVAANNEIVYFENGEFTLEDLGLIQGIELSQSLSGGHKLRLLTGGVIESLVDKDTGDPYAEVGNSSWTVYEAAENIKFRNKRTSMDEVFSQIMVGDLIQYSVNSEGKINSIKVLTPDAELSNDPYNPKIQSFGGEFYVDKNTAVFCMPTNDAEDEDYFTKVTLDSGIDYDICGFEIDEDTQVAKAVVIRQEMISDQPGKISNAKEIAIVNKLVSRLEGDGQVLTLNCFADGEEINKTIKDESNVYSIAKGLRFGDVIYFSENSMGYVDNIEFVKSLVPAPLYFHEDQRLQNEKVFGKLHTVTRNRLDKTTNQQMSAFTINLGTSEDADQELVGIRIPTTRMPVVYMIDSRRKKIDVVTIDDLLSTEEVGYYGASDVLICKKKYNATGIVVLK